jgi:hypothetical protein
VPTTVTTTAGDFTIPDYADPADVPQWLRTIVQRLGNDLLPAAGGGGFTSGALADRPAATAVKRGALYRITGDADASNLYVSDGASWYALGAVLRVWRAVSTAVGSTPATVQGFTGQTADLFQWVNAAGAILSRISPVGRFHGLVSALSAAVADVPLFVQGFTGQTGDLQRWVDATGAVLARVSPRGALLQPIAPVTTFGLDSAANGYRPLTITVTNVGATITYSTTTLTYDATSGNLTRVVTVADGRTLQRDLTYDGNGNLASTAESITAGV